MSSQATDNSSTVPLETLPQNQPLRLEMPKPQFQSIVPSDYGESDQEESRADAAIPEEDANAVVGVSISREQTRLMSPRTPAAEKAAAMDKALSGMFDGIGEESPGESEGYMTSQETATQAPPGPQAPQARDEETSPPRQGLPSPWTATPKTFEKTKVDDQNSLIRKPLVSSGPTSMLLDLNVRRFISSFNLPSLPKTPSFKDFALPGMSAILGGSREHLPQRKASARPKRAQTLSGSMSASDSKDQSQLCQVQDYTRGREQSSPKSPMVGRQRAQQSVLLRPAVVRASSQEALKSGGLNSSQIPRDHLLRRSTSDQSLLLRRATSTSTSLGDDSRWENVQDQVNSRFKAVVDSLQDSSIKMPSLPSLPNFHFHGFRPDFTRSRGNSEVKQPTRDRSGSANAFSNARDIDPEQAKPPKISDGSKQNRKPSKMDASYLDQALEQFTGDIIIMGGYRGSVLRSAKPPHHQQWVPIKVGLNIRRVNLEVGLEPEDEENMRDHIVASGMLTHIGPVDMGRRLIKRLRYCRNAQEGKLRVFDYGYDWRLSPALLSRRLIKILEKLPCNVPNTPPLERGATVIAHSMGGLITRHAVNQRPELFAGVIYAGVPQHCVNILGPLRNGDEVLLSSKVLTAQVNFTFRTSFVLLPENGRCFIDKQTKEEYPVDFFNVDAWKEYAFSPCIAPALPALQPEKKGLLGSVSDSFTSFPLPGRKASTSISSSRDSENDSNPTLGDATNTAATKINDITNLTSNAMEPQPNTHYNPHPTNPSATNSTIPFPVALNYLQRTLAETLNFKSALAFDPVLAKENAYPPLAILYGTSVPTVAAARVSGREGIKRADAYDDLAFASGDGVCLAKAAMLPEGYKCVRGGKIRTERGHVGLLGDLEAVGRCLLAIGDGRRAGIGLGVGKEEVGNAMMKHVDTSVSEGDVRMMEG